MLTNLERSGIITLKALHGTGSNKDNKVSVEGKSTGVNDSKTGKQKKMKIQNCSQVKGS
jgi:hypothetical protein